MGREGEGGASHVWEGRGRETSQEGKWVLFPCYALQVYGICIRGCTAGCLSVYKRSRREVL